MTWTWGVRPEKDESGATVLLTDVPSIIEAVSKFYDWIDQVSGHRLCNTGLAHKIIEWYDKNEKVLLEVRISWEQYLTLFPQMDEDEDEDEEDDFNKPLLGVVSPPDPRKKS